MSPFQAFTAGKKSLKLSHVLITKNLFIPFGAQVLEQLQEVGKIYSLSSTYREAEAEQARTFSHLLHVTPLCQDCELVCS